MNIDLRRMLVSCAAAVGLLAATSMGLRDWPLSAGAAPKAVSIVDDWPEPSRRAARAMIEMHGQPDRRSEDTLTWFGLYRGRRTVVHRSYSPDAVVEQVVLYRVPAAKGGEVSVLDGRIKIDREASELSARSESEPTNFLLLNLAHEVASGYRTVVEAQQFRDKEMRLAASGKSSRYREGLIFEEPLPSRSGLFILPGPSKKP